MSGVRYEFDDGPIRRHLAALAVLHATGYDRARREIGEYFKGEIQDAFDFQKLFDGSPMPKSKAAQTRKGGPGKTLLDHGHLRNSYTYNLIQDGLEIGSGSVYAAIHHFGGPAKAWGKYPFTMTARPVMGMTPEHEEAIGDYLIKEIKAAQGGLFR